MFVIVEACGRGGKIQVRANNYQSPNWKEDWNAGEEGSHPPVGQDFPPWGKFGWKTGAGKRVVERVARESKLRSPPSRQDPFLLLFCSAAPLSFFLRPFLLHFSPPSLLACTVKAAARRKEDGIGMGGRGRGNEVGSEENRKSLAIERRVAPG